MVRASLRVKSLPFCFLYPFTGATIPESFRRKAILIPNDLHPPFCHFERSEKSYARQYPNKTSPFGRNDIWQKRERLPKKIAPCASFRAGTRGISYGPSELCFISSHQSAILNPKSSHMVPSRNTGSRPWPGFGRPDGPAWKTANRQIDRIPEPSGQNTWDRQ